MEPSLANIKDMIRRPDNAGHMMRIKPVGRSVTVEANGHILAQSDEAVWVMEIGKDVYDPVLYLPLKDVKAQCEKSDNRTHCPLKGDCCYFSFQVADGENLAWQYDEPMVFARELEDKVGFDATRVRVSISPVS